MVKRSLRVGSGIGPRTCAPVRFAVSTISAADWSISNNFSRRLVYQSMIEGLETDPDSLVAHNLHSLVKHIFPTCRLTNQSRTRSAPTPLFTQ